MTNRLQTFRTIEEYKTLLTATSGPFSETVMDSNNSKDDISKNYKRIKIRA